MTPSSCEPKRRPASHRHTSELPQAQRHCVSWPRRVLCQRCPTRRRLLSVDCHRRGPQQHVTGLRNSASRAADTPSTRHAQPVDPRVLRHRYRGPVGHRCRRRSRVGSPSAVSLRDSQRSTRPNRPPNSTAAAPSPTRSICGDTTTDQRITPRTPLLMLRIADADGGPCRPPGGSRDGQVGSRCQRACWPPSAGWVAFVSRGAWG